MDINTPWVPKYLECGFLKLRPCTSPERSTQQQECWPKEKMPGSAGCSGSYPITDIIKENRGVLLASDKATHDSPDYQVAIASNGECSMTSSSGFSGTTKNIVSYLRFEEGPCDMHVDKDAERETIVLDRSKPEHKMACSSKTFGTHGVDATIYKYPIDAKTMTSGENVAASKRIKPDTTGAAFKSPGHSGNFFFEFTNEYMVNNSGNIEYKTDGYVVSQDLPGDNSDSATLSAWIAHPGRAVHEDGETLFSFIPSGVIGTGVKQPARNFIDFALMPFGRIRFRYVFTEEKPDTDHATGEEYTLYAELRCEVTSPPQPALLNGHWHHVAVTINANDPDREVFFYVDGSYVKKQLVKQHCKMVKSHRSDGRSVKKVNPLDVMDGTAEDPNGEERMAAELGLQGSQLDFVKEEKEMEAIKAEAEGDLSKKLKFRHRREFKDAFSSLVYGGLYDVYEDTVTQPFVGYMDGVAYYKEKVSDDQIKMLSEDVPCAEGYNGDGYAYFPGLSAERGEEMLLAKAFPNCKPGPHTVRFRYLISQANGAKLDVRSSNSLSPKILEFAEPEGFDDTVLNRWSTSTAATFSVDADSPLELTLSAARGTSSTVGFTRRRLLQNLTASNLQMVKEPDPVGSAYSRLNPQESDGVPEDQFLPDDLQQTYSDIYNAIPRFTSNPEDLDEGKAWVKMDDVLKWVVGVASKDRFTVKTKKFPPPPPSNPSPPPVDTARECAVPRRTNTWRGQTSAVHSMSDIRHTNMTTRYISDLKCNYNTKFDTTHWNAEKWMKIEMDVYQDLGGEAYWQVSASAGKKVLFVDERDTHLEDTRPLGPSCGFKHPAYAVKYYDNM
jgi:hypothetical protein